MVFFNFRTCISYPTLAFFERIFFDKPPVLSVGLIAFDCVFATLLACTWNRARARDVPQQHWPAVVLCRRRLVLWDQDRTSDWDRLGALCKGKKLNIFADTCSPPWTHRTHSGNVGLVASLTEVSKCFRSGDLSIQQADSARFHASASCAIVCVAWLAPLSLRSSILLGAQWTLSASLVNAQQNRTDECTVRTQWVSV